MKQVTARPGLTDSEVIEEALRSLDEDRILRIGPRCCEEEPDRHHWLLDRAIVIPEHTTVLLENCRIKLSDRCRDNFFRSANCGMGVEDPQRIRDIHIRGVGTCVLEGADHPRATGDASKQLACPCPKTVEDLIRMADWIPQESRETGVVDFWVEHSHSYGTDAGKPGQSQYGDWRNIGILLANVEDFSIENLQIVEAHGWGISLEACSGGRVEKIKFRARMAREIDGLLQNMENQDGIDLRNGCHDIILSDITGGTGDDLIALTACAATRQYVPGGSERSTHVMHNDWSRREADIHDILIRNVVGYSMGGVCYMIRLLPANTKIWNVVIDGVIDNSPDTACRKPPAPDPDVQSGGVILLGDRDSFWGKNLPGSIRGLSISNVICNGNSAIEVQGYVSDSVICNIVNRNANCPVIDVIREDGLTNVATANLVSTGNQVIVKRQNPCTGPAEVQK